MATPVAPARERLLAAAHELFYDEGVQTVGIDRVIARAGVAKASLYNVFGSKEELVAAYLRERHTRTIALLRAAAARGKNPRGRLLALFDAQAEMIARPGFRGCPFASACAEAPEDGLIRAAAADFRADLRGLFHELAAATGAADPGRLATQLNALYDGTGMAARLEGDPSIVADARAGAETLLDAQLA